MKIKDEILINSYGQDLVDINLLIDRFSVFNSLEKNSFLTELINMITQSKSVNEDVSIAIKNSKLKQTYTPCVILRKGVAQHNLVRLSKLPENELMKVFVLLLSLFQVAYKRRFKIEKNDPNKWWYWDLNENNISNILENH
jgi:hypothetical protein